MSKRTHEFRVCWRREGRQTTTRIYQTEAAARRKIDGILALEEFKDRSLHWKDMPDLVALPELQLREVGEWRVAKRQALEASDDARDGIEQWAAPYDHDMAYGGPF